jgi:hypothetical protein
MSRILILAFILFLFLLPTSLQAAEFSGVTVDPAMIKLDLATDPDTFVIKYKNTTNSVLQLNFSAKDFTGLEEGWRVKFLTTEDAKNYHYSLSSWLDFNPESLLLKPNESGDLLVKIRQTNLSPGGHYASIVADIAPTKPQDGTVAIKSQLVSLAFIRASTGNERDEAKISSFTIVRNNFLSFPKQFSLRFDNTGNTQLTPHGLLTITDIFNHKVAFGILNEDSLITLPETIRKYDLNLAAVNHWLIPGPYHVNLTINYGQQQTTSTTSTFFILGSVNVILLEIILICLIIIFLKHRKTR